MRELAIIIGAVSCALAIAAISLFVLDDRSVLTSPPEAEVEGFVRSIVTGRSERAFPYLDEPLAGKVGADGLRVLAHRLRRGTGTVVSVTGEPVSRGRDSAVAAALIVAEQIDSVRLEMPLRFRSGVWSISGLGSLADLPENGAPPAAPAR